MGRTHAVENCRGLSCKLEAGHSGLGGICKAGILNTIFAIFAIHLHGLTDLCDNHFTDSFILPWFQASAQASLRFVTLLLNTSACMFSNVIECGPATA